MQNEQSTCSGRDRRNLLPRRGGSSSRRAVAAMALAVALSASAALAQPGGAPEMRPVDKAFAQAKQAADAAHEANRKEYAGKDRYLVRPGLLADKEKRTVKVWAAASELTDDDPVEFFLIHEDSGKAYEALAISYAKPSDVHAALEFIGMAPGEPIDYPQLRFWPKGERVALSFAWEADGKPRQASGFDLVRDMKTGKTMEDTGLMFVGSRTRTTDDGKTVYAADVAAGMSIASTYNEPTTVLDIPWQAPQGTVYGRFKPNPDQRLDAATPLTITLQPRRKADNPRVRNLRLFIKPPRAMYNEQSLRYELMDEAALDGARVEAPLNDKPTLVSLFAALEAIRGKDQDPFVTIAAVPDLKLGQMQTAAEMIAKIDKRDGIRVEPPLQGHLYYKAFTPDPKRRALEERLFHGWELTIRRRGETIDLDLSAAEDVRNPQTGEWELRVQRFEAKTPKEIAATMRKVDVRGPRDVYVFAPADLTYGKLLRALQPAIESHNTVLVYLDLEAD